MPRRTSDCQVNCANFQTTTKFQRTKLPERDKRSTDCVHQGCHYNGTRTGFYSLASSKCQTNLANYTSFYVESFFFVGQGILSIEYLAYKLTCTTANGTPLMATLLLSPMEAVIPGTCRRHNDQKSHGAD